MKLNVPSVAVLAAWLIIPGMSDGATVVLADNLVQTIASPSGYNVDASVWSAQSFATTADGYIITEITLPLRKASTYLTEGTFEIRIYSTGVDHQIDTIAAVAATLDTASFTAPGWNLRTISNLNIKLEPSTNYYLALCGTNITGSQGMWWAFTRSTAGTGFPANLITTSYGGTPGLDWGPAFTTTPTLMKIVAVPEPSTWLLAGLAMMPAAFRRRKTC